MPQFPSLCKILAQSGQLARICSPRGCNRTQGWLLNNLICIIKTILFIWRQNSKWNRFLSVIVHSNANCFILLYLLTSFDLIHNIIIIIPCMLLWLWLCHFDFCIVYLWVLYIGTFIFAFCDKSKCHVLVFSFCLCTFLYIYNLCCLFTFIYHYVTLLFLSGCVLICYDSQRSNIVRKIKKNVRHNLESH